uniref:M protein n=1 Tax=Drosophila melanogaster TaxID=7227 RepID=Q7JRH7_DROME|eukprot:NP_611272.1 olf186-M [Drosophila melanogaster]
MERSHSCSNFEGRTGAKVIVGAVEQLAGSSEHLPSVHFPPSKPLRRRRKLQRQQSAVDTDDMEYAADLEENADPDAHEHMSPVVTMPMRHISATSTRCLRHEESFESSSTAPELSPQAQRQQRFSSLLLRDSSVSVQSDSSRYSSVDSLLEARKPDPEAILINLGFGPLSSEDMLSRIPRRFLKPSQVPGIDTDAFVQRLTLARSLADSSVLGYRGLTGNPDMPPSSIVASIMKRFEVNHHRKNSMGSIKPSIQ